MAAAATDGLRGDKSEEEAENFLVVATGPSTSSFKPPPLGSRRKRHSSAASTGTTTNKSKRGADGCVAKRYFSIRDDDIVVDPRFTETATFGLGCFWGAEAAFRHELDARSGALAVGVTRVGYTGGRDERGGEHIKTPASRQPQGQGQGMTTPRDGGAGAGDANDAEFAVGAPTGGSTAPDNPSVRDLPPPPPPKAAKKKPLAPLTLKDVKTGKFGHAEVVRVRYDPTFVSYDDLLGVFWASHDPVAKKANDKYRSVIFAHTMHHAREAEASVRAAKERLGEGVTTKVVTIPDELSSSSSGWRWWPAEEKDQMYFAKNAPVAGGGGGEEEGQEGQEGGGRSVAPSCGGGGGVCGMRMKPSLKTECRTTEKMREENEEEEAREKKKKETMTTTTGAAAAAAAAAAGVGVGDDNGGVGAGDTDGTSSMTSAVRGGDLKQSAMSSSQQSAMSSQWRERDSQREGRVVLENEGTTSARLVTRDDGHDWASSRGGIGRSSTRSGNGGAIVIATSLWHSAISMTRIMRRAATRMASLVTWRRLASARGWTSDTRGPHSSSSGRTSPEPEES